MQRHKPSKQRHKPSKQRHMQSKQRHMRTIKAVLMPALLLLLRVQACAPSSL